MATVVDELIIRLGLDPSEFEKGRKRAVQDLLQTRQATQKTGKDIEDTAKKAGAGIERLTRNIIGMFAAFAGAKSLTELVTGLTKANAEIGRFSANVGLVPQSVAAWGMAVQRIGGDAGNAQGSIAKLSTTITNFRNGLGQMPQEFWFLRQRSGVNINPLGNTEEVLTGISEAIQRLSKTDRQSAFNFAQALGIDDKTFEVMRQHGAGVKEYLQNLEKYAPSDRSIKQAEKLQEAWGKLVQTIAKVVQDIMEKVSPHLEKIVNSITAMVERLSNGVDWKAVDEGMAQFAGAVKSASENMDGLTVAVGAFFALWTGAQFAKVLANMLLLRGGGVAAAGAGGGAMSSLAKGLPWLAALGVLIANKNAIGKANQDSIAWTEAYNHSKELVERGSPGPSTRGGRKRGIGTMGGMRYTSGSGSEPVLHPSLMNDNLSVEGRPVGKGNPMPVTITQGSASGGGFWDTIASWFTGTPPGQGGSSNSSGGGGVFNTVRKALGFGGGSGGGDNGDAVTSVPNLTGMTDAERNKLGLILKYESRGKNVMNYVGRGQGIDPNTAKGYTAQGYYQILNSNWRRLAPKLGIKTTNAMSSSLEDQTKVALALMRESGIGNWANWNPSLRSALKRGESAGSWGERVPTSNLNNVTPGAELSALTNSISNDNRQSSSSSNVDTRIGNVNVFTQATDSKTIADRLWDDLYSRIGQGSAAAAANTGPV